MLRIEERPHLKAVRIHQSPYGKHEGFAHPRVEQSHDKTMVGNMDGMVETHFILTDALVDAGCDCFVVGLVVLGV